MAVQQISHFNHLFDVIDLDYEFVSIDSSDVHITVFDFICKDLGKKKNVIINFLIRFFL